MKKYLLSTFRSTGLCNVLSELEIGLALSYITDRTFLLPNIYDRFVTDTDTMHLGYLWDILDKDAISQEFNVEFINKDINYLDVNEYKKYLNIQNNDDIHFLTDLKTNRPHGICYFNSKKITDIVDFKNFYGNNRPFSKNVNVNNDFLFYDDCHHYFYLVYPGTAKFRNNLKTKINSAIKFKKKYEDIANNFIENNLKKFNAIHIRYAIFFDPDVNNYTDIRPHMLNIKDRPDKLYNRISMLYEKDLPLYISTDLATSGLLYNPPVHIDLNEYLNPLKKDYNIFTLKDINLNLKSTEETAIEQIICYKAEKFYGTYGSTFSKRINAFRGAQGKPTTDYMGWNMLQEPWMEVNSPWPWTTLKTGWGWFYSNYVQHTLEKE